MAPRRKSHRPQKCLDCRIDTLWMEESAEAPVQTECYMVRDEIWSACGIPKELPHGRHVFMCVGCLEARLGRRLTPADFDEVPLNSRERHAFGSTARLLDRMGYDDLASV